MWVYLTDALLSIVAHRDRPADLLVRARFRGDIEAVFPDAAVTETLDADYRFRATLPREVVARAIADRAAAIDYPNFKGTLPHRTRTDHARADAYHAAHAAGLAAQDTAPPA
jgi:hypothetical protein